MVEPQSQLNGTLPFSCKAIKNDIVVKNIGFLESILHLGKKSENEKLKKSCEKKSLEKAVIFDYIDYTDPPSPRSVSPPTSQRARLRSGWAILSIEVQSFKNFSF